MLSRLKLGSAFRFSRNAVGGLSGFLFSMDSIFKAPIKYMKPAIVVGFFGTIIFIFKARENYKKNVPTFQNLEEYQNNKIQHTTARIVTDLMLYPNKLAWFQESKQYQDCEKGNPATELQEVIINLLNEQLNHPIEVENIIFNFTFTFFSAIAQTGSYFMECLFVKTFDDPELFNLNSFSIDNIFIGILALFAVYNGYQTIKEKSFTQQKYYIDSTCETFIDKINTQARL